MSMRNMVRSEDTEQMVVIQWAQYNAIHFPELKWLHHVPNGGSRNKLEAVKLKQMGVKAGVSDLCLPYPKGIYCGLYIEMKYGNNRRQETQKDFLADMAAAGHFVATCYSADDAIRVIMQYLTLKSAYPGMNCHAPFSASVMEIPNNSIIRNGEVKAGA